MDMDFRQKAAVCLQNCYAANLRRVSRAVSNLYDEKLSVLGLKATQMTLLLVLASGTRLTMTDIARQLEVTVSTINRSLVILERRGLVDIGDGSARTRLVVLTGRGETLLEKAMPIWLEAQEEAQGMLAGLKKPGLTD